MRSAREPALVGSPEAGSYIDHAGLDELHQVLVGGDDEHVGAFAARASLA